MTRPTFDEEEVLWQQGYKYVIGVDEVGRGAFAGPLVVGAVVFDRNKKCTKEILDSVNDSKLLKSQLRKTLAELIKKQCLKYQLITVDVSSINRFGVGKANYIAIRSAVKGIMNQQLAVNSGRTFVLIDGFKIPYLPGGKKHSAAVVKGDRKSISIAAASIIAKVYRDELMTNLHLTFKEYGFDKHKGYGTKSHQNVIKQLGLSKIHRTSFNLSKFTN